MRVATNPDTGESVVFINDEWVKPESVAKNDKGEQAFLVNGQWIKESEEPSVAKPAMANPNIAAQVETARNLQRPTANQSLGTIGGATVLGGIAGALSPEILTGLGGAAAMQGHPVGRTLMGMGSVLQQTGRAIPAVAGAISGFGGSVAEESARAMGASPGVALAAGVAGGFLPEIGPSVVAKIGSRMTGAPVKAILDYAKATIEQKIGRKISDEETRLIEKSLADFREKNGKQSFQSIYDALETGAKQERAEAAALSGRLLDQGKNDANRVITETMNGPVARYKNGAEQLRQMADDYIKTAENSRYAIGRDVDDSTIGSELREVISNKNKTLLKARSDQAIKDKEEVLNIVKQNESSGKKLADLPEYKNVLNELRDKLLKGQGAQNKANGLAPVTEEGVYKGYERIYDAMKGRRIATEFDQEGNPTAYKTFATSYEALDHLRQKLGTVFTGKPAEGYESITEGIARDFYKKIRDIQVKFTGGEGGAGERFLDNYHMGSDSLKEFLSKNGQRMVAMQKGNPEKYMTDAKDIPANVFRSKQNIVEAIQLSGDKNIVTQAGLDYATNRLAGKDEAGVRKFMTDNREMMDTLPDVKKAVSEYADRLQMAERRSKTALSGINIVSNLEAEARKRAESIAGDIIKTAEKQSQNVTSTAQKNADFLMGNKEIAPRIKELVEKGDKTTWDRVGPVIAQSQTGKASVARAVRETIADMLTPSNAIKKSQDLLMDFNDRLLPSLERSGLMPKTDADKLVRDLNNISLLKIPEKEKLGVQKRLILQTVTAASATALSKGAVMGTGALMELLPAE